MAAADIQYRCATHSDEVMTELYQFYKDGLYTDVVVIGSLGSISCHSQVLMGNGAELCRMLNSQTIEGGAREINCPTACVSIIQSLIEIMYTGELTITADGAKGLLQLAEQLQIKKVVTAVEEFMQTQVDPSNCITLLRYSQEHHLTKLHDASRLQILERFSDICEKDDFLNLTLNELKCFIGDNNLNAPFENMVYDAVMRWVKHSTETRANPDIFLQLIKLVRLPFCTSQFLNDVVSKEELMDNYQCFKMLYQAQIYKLNPDGTHEFTDCQQTVARTTTIPTGTTFLFGGAVDGDYTLSAACYKLHILNNKWEKFTEVPYEHRRSSTCYVNDGLFICGGDKANNNNVCWFYNLKASQWEKKTYMLTPRHAHTLVALNDDVCVIGGGFNGKILADVDRYRFSENTWHTLTKLKLPVCYAPVVVHGKTLYIFSGQGAASKRTRHCQRIDVASMTCTYISDLPIVMSGQAAVLVDNDVFLVGGWPSVCYHYRTDTDLFTVMTAPHHIHCFGAAFVHNKKIVILGGASADHTNMSTVCEVYSLKKNQWTESKPDLPVGLWRHKVHRIT